MSIGTVTLMTPAEKAKVRQDVQKYDRLTEEIRILKAARDGKITDLLPQELIKLEEILMGQMVRPGAEGNAGLAATKKIDQYNQNIVNAEAKRTELNKDSDHRLLLIAISRIIQGRFSPSREAMAKATTPEARKALQMAASKAANDIVKDFMEQFESRGITLSHFAEDAQCMHLTENTVPVILASMKKAEWSSADLTKFKGKIDQKALNALWKSGQVADALFALEAEALAIEQLNKGIRVFVLKNNIPTEIKSAPMSISTSTKSTPPPPNVKKDSPENSPPKAIAQSAKPLPPKPLPKPPGKKDTVLEAK